MPDEIPALYAIVKFGKGIPGSVQGPALLEFERVLRREFRKQFPGLGLEEAAFVGNVDCVADAG